MKVPSNFLEYFASFFLFSPFFFSHKPFSFKVPSAVMKCNAQIYLTFHFILYPFYNFFLYIHSVDPFFMFFFGKGDFQKFLYQLFLWQSFPPHFIVTMSFHTRKLEKIMVKWASIHLRHHLAPLAKRWKHGNLFCHCHIFFSSVQIINKTRDKLFAVDMK